MQKKGNTNYQKNIGSAALFALAVLILVISCPVKRLLINNDVSQTSQASQSHSTKNIQNAGILYSGITSCAAEINKPAILQVDKSQHKKTDAPLFNYNIFNRTGYYIHSFLSGTKAEYNLVPNSDLISLPLFLQHRSLLI